jgi:hypothetical protein
LLRQRGWRRKVAGLAAAVALLLVAAFIVVSVIAIAGG